MLGDYVKLGVANASRLCGWSGQSGQSWTLMLLRPFPAFALDNARSLPLSDSAVAALAAAVLGDGFYQVFAGEIGPKFGDYVHLGVADLPQ